MKSKPITKILKALLSILFLYLLINMAGTKGLLEIIRDINPAFLFISLLISVCMVCLSCLKWKVLLDLLTKDEEERPSYLFLLKTYLVGYFFSNLLPSNIGGDIARLYYAGHKVNDHIAVAASIFIERMTGLILLLSLAAFAPFCRVSLYGKIYVAIPSVAALILLILIIVLLTIKDPITPINSVAVRFLNFLAGTRICARNSFFSKLHLRVEAFCEKFIHKIEAFHERTIEASKYILWNKPTFAVVVLLSIAFYAATWLNVYFSFRTFNTIPDFAGVVALVPLVMLAAMLPISIMGNLGFTEGVYVTYFSLLGIDPANILAMGLFLRFKLFLIGIFGLVSYLTMRREHARGNLGEGERNSIEEIIALEPGEND